MAVCLTKWLHKEISHRRIKSTSGYLHCRRLTESPKTENLKIFVEATNLVWQTSNLAIVRESHAWLIKRDVNVSSNMLH